MQWVVNIRPEDQLTLEHRSVKDKVDDEGLGRRSGDRREMSMSVARLLQPVRAVPGINDGNRRTRVRMTGKNRLKLLRTSSVSGSGYS